VLALAGLTAIALSDSSAASRTTMRTTGFMSASLARNG
jgi:hypothetical protein